jgi:hypothetical protein
MRNLKVGLAIVCAIALSACQKNSVTGISDVQTQEHFSKDPELAKQVTEKCLAFERKELSLRSPNQQKEWENSDDGINCRNAKAARSWHILSERQRAMEESNRKVFGDDTK